MIVTIAMRRRQSTLGPVCEPLKRRGMLGRSCQVVRATPTRLKKGEGRP